MDYYSILGVNRNASPEDIKRAYRKLAMKHHPDRGGDASKLQEINEAYDTLKDPQKKSAYDNPQTSFKSQDFAGGFNNFDDVFASMFRHSQQRPRHPVNNDITVAASISLEDVFVGKDLIVAYRLSNGKQETVEISVPPGARHGDTIRYEGLGDNRDHRFPRGNLFIKIKVQKNKKWNREENNVVTKQMIDIFDLMQGTAITLETPEKKLVRVNIPPGTQVGTVLSVTGYGIPDLHTRKRGNLYLIINTRIPKLDSQEDIKKLRKFRNAISTST